MTPRPAYALATAATLGIALVAVLYAQGLAIPYPAALALGYGLLAVAALFVAGLAYVALRGAALQVARVRRDLVAWWRTRRRLGRMGGER